MLKPIPTTEEVLLLNQKQDKKMRILAAVFFSVFFSLSLFGDVYHEWRFVTSSIMVTFGFVFLLFASNMKNFSKLYQNITLEELKQLEKYAGDPELVEYVNTITTMKRELYHKEFKELLVYFEDKYQKEQKLNVLNCLRKPA